MQRLRSNSDRELFVGDRYDVEGQITGFGNPDWALTHEAATHTAPAVQILVKAGAKCIGKTHMDEVAFRFISFDPCFSSIFRSRVWIELFAVCFSESLSITVDDILSHLS